MDDTISRQAAIDEVNEWIKAFKENGHKESAADAYFIKDAIKQLPSAQPYTIHSDGRLWITVDDIDKVTAVVVDEHKSKFCKQFYEVAQPKMGRWIHHPEIGWGETWLCDQCGEKTTSTVMGKPRANFCPNCGADMREVTI